MSVLGILKKFKIMKENDSITLLLSSTKMEKSLPTIESATYTTMINFGLKLEKILLFSSL